MNNYTKSELTEYAKLLAKAANALFDALCYCEEVYHLELTRDLLSDLTGDGKLFNAIAKRYSKYGNTDITIDVDNGEVQQTTRVLERIFSILTDPAKENL